MEHELIVTITDTQGNVKSADRRWARCDLETGTAKDQL